MTRKVLPPGEGGPTTRNNRDLSPEAQRRRAETCRLRIETTGLIDRLQKHAMGRTKMTPTQLAAAQSLLRKTLPDLVGVKAELDASPVVFNFNMGTKPKE
jgi:hypothetical protein